MNEETPQPANPKLAYGMQVAFGFFLPLGACGLTFLGLAFTGGMTGGWSTIGVLLSGVVGVLALAAGLWFASQQRWRGVLLGLVLFGALVVLLIGACFAMLASLGGKSMH